MGILYLASPYSHHDPEVVRERFVASCKAAARLMREGHVVFSPIAHTHNIADYLPDNARYDFEFWMLQDIPVLLRCNELRVLPLEGWRESRGVTREIEIARHAGIPVQILSLDILADNYRRL